MISMMRHSSDCLWHTHTHTLFRANEELAHWEKKIIFSSIFSEWFANSARRLKWTSVHKVHCAHADVVIRGYECKCVGTMWLQACDFSHLLPVEVWGDSLWAWYMVICLSFPPVWRREWGEAEEGQGLGWAEKGGGLCKKNKLSLLQPTLTLHSDWVHGCCSQMFPK